MQAKSLCFALVLVLLCARAHGATLQLQGTLRDMAPSYMAHGNFPEDYWKYNGWVDAPKNGSCGTANAGKGFNNSDFELPLWMYGSIRTPNAKGGVLYNGEVGLVGALCNNSNSATCGRLDADRKPVYAYPGRSPTGNVQSPASFYTWFHDSEVSITKPFTLTLNNIAGNTFKYENSTFFPIDGQGWNDWNVADDGKTKHNYGFTLEFHSSFTYEGGEKLSYVGTGDFWVFVDNRLVMDVGGIHTSKMGNINFDAISGLVRGHVYRLDMFFAQRHTTLSEFTLITTSPTCAYYDRCGVCEGDGNSCPTCSYYDRCGVCEGDGNSCPTCSYYDRCGVCEGDGNSCPTCSYYDWCGVCEGDGTSCACNTTSQCDDKNSCTVDTCKNGMCAHTAIVCDDKNSCTTDSCNVKTGSCVFTPITCNDQNSCTTDSCSNGTCKYVLVTCDDANSCTIDTCNAHTGCTHRAIECNDNNACTTEKCDNGTCVYTPIACNDGNYCTTDKCDLHGGCVYTPVVCEDNNVCTTETCDAHTGTCVFTPIKCDDNNSCTSDACDPHHGCVYTPKSSC